MPRQVLVGSAALRAACEVFFQKNRAKLLVEEAARQRWRDEREPAAVILSEAKDLGGAGRSIAGNRGVSSTVKLPVSKTGL